MLAAVLSLLYAWPTMRDRVIQLIDVVSTSTDRPFSEVLQRAVYGTIEVLVMATAPLVVVVFAVGVMIGMLAAMLGPVFSFENVKPEFDHINPTQGLLKPIRHAT